MYNYLINASVLECKNLKTAKEIDDFYNAFNIVSKLKETCHDVSVWFSTDTIYKMREYFPEESVRNLSDDSMPLDIIRNRIRKWFYEMIEKKQTFEDQFKISDDKKYKYKSDLCPRINNPIKTPSINDLFYKDANMIAHLNFAFHIEDFILVIRGNLNPTKIEITTGNIVGSVCVTGINKSIINNPQHCDTIREAYNKACAEFKNLILFGPQADPCSRLEKDAGPPDKIYYYLVALSKVAEFLRSKNGLQNVLRFNSHIAYHQVPCFCASLFGCDCAPESKTTMNCTELKQKRSFHVTNAISHVFSFHLRPATQSRNQSTQKYGTVRIYFDWDPTSKKIIVGYIGGHLDTKSDYEDSGICKRCQTHTCLRPIASGTPTKESQYPCVGENKVNK